ncbi:MULTISPECIES: DUF4097 family beta strand repeat-containing protein [unclassified Streptomyces]|uniref:DUF4097 family beta strand repeat-containing protein n=1 Tax=unclassified Streptomyces TaxID=2593676 RepID=UPI000DC7C954|nr:MULTISPECIES: DUF4097 family beta strand repeat-containing protein [unclassified Streptomyces]AWZ09346.1 hypothetical protein DRB89_38245 [Streptomyces sp. ICC4]AWZ14750.1 hypothetical protein DRB96_23600 [Streptomyces sp. ICC1]
MTTKTSARTSTATAAWTAAALAAGLLLTGCQIGSLTEQRKTVTADTEVTEAVRAVDVSDARSGSIEVTAGSGPGVVVRRTVRYRGDAVPEPAQRVADGVLTLTNGSCSGRCSIDYRLEVPATATVRLDGSSGRVTVSGVAAADVETSSGDVRADRIAGALKIRTSSGEITAEGLAGPGADARSGSGDVRLAFVKAPSSVAVETGSGEAWLSLPPAPYALDVSTASGERDITLPADPSATARLAVKTSSGDIRISAA